MNNFTQNVVAFILMVAGIFFLGMASFPLLLSDALKEQVTNELMNSTFSRYIAPLAIGLLFSAGAIWSLPESRKNAIQIGA